MASISECLQKTLEDEDRLISKSLSRFWLRGYICSIARNAALALCGYVNVPYAVAYSLGESNLMLLDVHGGITYYREAEEGIIVGFDCAHFNDFCPGQGYSIGKELDYKNVDYVITQLNLILDQIIIK